MSKGLATTLGRKKLNKIWFDSGISPDQFRVAGNSSQGSLVTPCGFFFFLNDWICDIVVSIWAGKYWQHWTRSNKCELMKQVWWSKLYSCFSDTVIILNQNSMYCLWVCSHVRLPSGTTETCLPNRPVIVFECCLCHSHSLPESKRIKWAVLSGWER